MNTANGSITSRSVLVLQQPALVHRDEGEARKVALARVIGVLAGAAHADQQLGD